jgi:hypothetical protein
VQAVNRSVDCWLSRHKSGIKVSVKVVPEVENFFKQWGGGLEEGPAHGRLWRPADDRPIRLWSFDTNLKDENLQYDLMKTGTNLVNDYDGSVNISFLRLVGASEPGGRAFILEAPISYPELERIAQRITRVSEQFFLNYVQPVNINVYVGTVDYSRSGLVGGIGEAPAG